MPIYQLIITSAAENEIKGAQRWYETQANLGYAFVSSVGKQLDFIECHPFATPIVAHGIRRSLVNRFPYKIYYMVNGLYINILAVWHGSRNQEKLLERLSRLQGE